MQLKWGLGIGDWAQSPIPIIKNILNYQHIIYINIINSIIIYFKN